MGWVKIDRELINSEFWLSQPFTDGQAWVDLIAMANWKDSKCREGSEVKTIKRGDVLTSYRALAERWQWSTGKVRRYLTFLEKAEMVKVTSTAFNTVLTLENYGIYQDARNTDEHTNEHADGTTTDTPTVQRQTLSEEGKNKEIRNVCVERITHTFGKLSNVELTSEEYDDLFNTYKSTSKLIDKVSLWLPDNPRSNHYAVCLKFAETDNWPKKKTPAIQEFEEPTEKSEMPEELRAKIKGMVKSI